MKKFSWVDIAIIAAIIAALTIGFVTFKNFRRTAGKQIVATQDIVFQVFLRSITLTTDGENPIKAGDETFITIRNVPYSNVKVLESIMDTKKTVVATKNQPVIVDDYSQIGLYDIVVTLTDKAEITKDGAVVGGNKIKIGLPITL
ncbi:DUF4330 domain-containing protein, partial [bacterium]|nr:DUF4330 domain-containing protein [bacterium]